MLLRPQIPVSPTTTYVTDARPAVPAHACAPCSCQHMAMPQATSARGSFPSVNSGAVATVLLGGVVLTALLAAVAVTAVSVAVAAVVLRGLLSSRNRR